ncbi:MAG: hypothetical protein HQL95_03540 [Magnetococcales bacterium]|nr:hypothetical protein [Magnetococcales bacterium]
MMTCWLPGVRAEDAASREAQEAVLRVLDRAFCAPNEIFPQPNSWIEQPIRPDRWAKDGALAVTLDQQIHQLLLPEITRYAREHDLDIRVREGTCGTSAGLVSRKAVDIGGFCCPPGKSDRLPGLTFHTLGIASIAILAHPENPLEGLTLDQLKGMFQGRQRLWSELGEVSGKSAPAWEIQPVGRLHCKLRPGHWRALLWDPDDFSPRMEEVGTIPDMIQRVLAQRGGIGYETLWHVNHFAERFPEKGRPRALRLDGVAPDDVPALLQGRYPFYHVFNLTLWEGEGVANPRARALVEHLVKAVEGMDPRMSMIPAAALRQAGWQFQKEELVGAPPRP